MRCESNRNLISSRESEDFVVATDLSSMMLAQISNDVRRAGVFNELLNENGSEAYLKQASEFGLLDQEFAYEELLEKVYAFGYILIGIKEPNKSFRILGRNKENITLNEGDQLVVIGEE